ncbi:MAG: hypothetical protein HGB03_00325 [Candidatus Yonathbacteria bacterium]|nr:hypothetical protein [Candidatus Yonathbacteria bacterium]NTW47712.1 hypothetical protein [Candidatus Yonathbacteria bacterium]
MLQQSDVREVSQEIIERLREASGFDADHPEKKEGEVFLMNSPDKVNPETGRTFFEDIPYTTKRKGICAYDRDGIPYGSLLFYEKYNKFSGVGHFPVFVEEWEIGDKLFAAMKALGIAF